jgi:hypothetical protein
MQAVALSRAHVTRCSALQGADATTTRAAPPAAGAALARRQALCAGAAGAVLALGAQPRRAVAVTPSFSTAACGLQFYDDKVGTGEEAAAGDVVKILYSAHTVDADGAPFAMLAVATTLRAYTRCERRRAWEHI